MKRDNCEADGLRLDKWLFHARFVKQRSMATELLRKRRIRVNDQLMSKAHFKIRPGDVVTLVRPEKVTVVEVLGLGERRGPASEAQDLYRLIDSFD